MSIIGYNLVLFKFSLSFVQNKIHRQTNSGGKKKVDEIEYLRSFE